MQCKVHTNSEHLNLLSSADHIYHSLECSRACSRPRTSLRFRARRRSEVELVSGWIPDALAHVCMLVYKFDFIEMPANSPQTNLIRPRTSILVCGKVCCNDVGSRVSVSRSVVFIYTSRCEGCQERQLFMLLVMRFWPQIETASRNVDDVESCKLAVSNPPYCTCPSTRHEVK